MTIQEVIYYSAGQPDAPPPPGEEGDIWEAHEAVYVFYNGGWVIPPYELPRRRPHGVLKNVRNA